MAANKDIHIWSIQIVIYNFSNCGAEIHISFTGMFAKDIGFFNFFLLLFI